MRPAYCLAPPLLAAVGATLTFDPTGVRPWPRPADDPAAAAARLDDERQSTGDRAAARQRVGADLAAGRLTADQAAARMGELNRTGPPGARTEIRARFPRATDEAITYWQAVRYAALADPDTAAGLAADHRRRFPDGPDPDYPTAIRTARPAGRPPSRSD